MTPTRDPRNPADTSSTQRDNKRAEAEFSLNPPNAPGVPRRETAAGEGAVGGEGASGHEPTAIHIDAWLNAFARLLNLPAERRREIVAELEAHLTERVRDLMIDGHAEAAATQLAIRELGDAAVIASRFHKAERTHPRRWIMNTLILGVSAAAISLSTLALRQAAVAPPSHPPNSPPAQSSTISAQSTTPESLSSLDPDFATTTTAPEPMLTVRAGETAAEFFDDFAKSLGVTAFVRWDQLESIKITRDASIPMGTSGLPLDEAWTFMQQQINGGRAIGWRLHHDQVEIALAEELDSREIELVCYDLTKFLSDYPSSETQNIMGRTAELIYDTVQPEYWKDRGGRLGAIHVVGRKLFVYAPRRLHSQVRWILNELEQPGDSNGATLRRPEQNQTPESPGPAAFHDALTRDRSLNLSGLVENPGNYLMPDGPLTLRRLIEVGGGLKPGAASIRIERRLDSGDIGTFARMTATDLSSKSAATDPVLAAGDVIIVE